MDRLTEAQEDVLDFLKSFYKKKGFAPSRAEICKNFGWASPNAAQQHLVLIEKKGYISFDDRAHRNIIIR